MLTRLQRNNAVVVNRLASPKHKQSPHSIHGRNIRMNLAIVPSFKRPVVASKHRAVMMCRTDQSSLQIARLVVHNSDILNDIFQTRNKLQMGWIFVEIVVPIFSVLKLTHETM